LDILSAHHSHRITPLLVSCNWLYEDTLIQATAEGLSPANASTADRYFLLIATYYIAKTAGISPPHLTLVLTPKTGFLVF
jgi:hypothetical protein